MLRTIEMYTNEYKDTTQKEIRKKKGQFFTPAEVSMRMAAVESEYPKNQWGDATSCAAPVSLRLPGKWQLW